MAKAELASTAMAKARRRLIGIRERHGRTCPAAVEPEARCVCEPTYEAAVWARRDGRKIRKCFASAGEARRWRTAMQKLSDDGGLRAPPNLTLEEAAAAWLDGAERGAIRTRSGDEYKPSALRGYEQALRLRIRPALGAYRLGEITRSDLQRLVGSWQGQGLSPSSIRNTVNALRALYRNADLLTEGTIVTNPTQGLRLPAVRGRRERIAAPDEASRLLAALPEGDRALWATALYAGLRLGELRALDWQHVDLAGGTIGVERSYDPKAGFVAPKSRAGVRRVPIASVLRELLATHKMSQKRRRGLVFGRAADRPFQATSVYARAKRRWKAAGLDPIGFHECRHTCASYFIAAGVNAKTLSTFLGHASVMVTLDRYGHLFPGAESEAAGMLDEYLARADTSARLGELRN